MDSYPEDAVAKQLTNPNTLEQLFKALSKQQNIIYHLQNHLHPINSPQPRNETVSGSVLQEGQRLHLGNAVDIARRNNDELNYIIDTLVV